MKTIVAQWNYMRILRIVLGLGILVQGIFDKDPMKIILALLFGGLVLANIGCYSTKSCPLNSKSN